MLLLTDIRAFISFQEAHSKCGELHAAAEEADARTKELEQHYKMKLDEANRQLAEKNEDEVKFQFIIFLFEYRVINSVREIICLVFE